MKTFQRFDELNASLMRDDISEAELGAMLEAELARDPPRRTFALRIRSRLDRVRAAREKADIVRRSAGDE